MCNLKLVTSASRGHGRLLKTILCCIYKSATTAVQNAIHTNGNPPPLFARRFTHTVLYNVSKMGTGCDLYGIQGPKANSRSRPITTSTSHAFTSQLSSLLASSDKSRTSSGRSRAPHDRSDIFTAHNKDTKKRAANDLLDDGQVLKRRNIGGVDETILHRSKRRMEEKARLYAAIKRGDYIAPKGDERHNLEELGLVDFDRKWAEQEERGEEGKLDTSSDADSGEEQEMVEYTDDLGRQRMGTRAEAAREERRKRLCASGEPDRFSARPAQPSKLIYGDAVQTAAFNPEESIAARIEEIARNRDREPTPPADTHYDASKEVRSKGVGFYAFSKDNRVREEEFEALSKERRATEQGRVEQEEKVAKRKAKIEERRRLIRLKKGERQADQFLEGLAGSLTAENLKDDDGRDTGVHIKSAEIVP